MSDETPVDRDETGTLMAFNLIVYGVPVVPGPQPPPTIRPAVPFLPLCETCGVRGCPQAHPRQPARWRWWRRR